MTLPRLPVTVWAWFSEFHSQHADFSASCWRVCAALLSDRFAWLAIFQHHFLSGPCSRRTWCARGACPCSGNDCSGISHKPKCTWRCCRVLESSRNLVSTFSRKPVWKERLVVLALCGVGLIGFCVWGLPHVRHRLEPLRSARFCGAGFFAGRAGGVFIGEFGWAHFGKLGLQLTTALLFPSGSFRFLLPAGLSGIFLARHDLGSAARERRFRDRPLFIL